MSCALKSSSSGQAIISAARGIPACARGSAHSCISPAVVGPVAKPTATRVIAGSSTTQTILRRTRSRPSPTVAGIAERIASRAKECAGKEGGGKGKETSEKRAAAWMQAKQQSGQAAISQSRTLSAGLRARPLASTLPSQPQAYYGCIRVASGAAFKLSARVLHIASLARLLVTMRDTEPA